MLQNEAKIRSPLHVCLNNSTTRPSVKNLYDTFLTKWPKMPKVCLHLKGDLRWQSWNSIPHTTANLPDYTCILPDTFHFFVQSCDYSHRCMFYSFPCPHAPPESKYFSYYEGSTLSEKKQLTPLYIIISVNFLSISMWVIQGSLEELALYLK